MATTSPARIDDELYASAKLAGEAQSRSASQQVAHWARIGRELEASASISVRAVRDVLAGRRSYDELDTEEQALVRAQWAERMKLYREDLDLPRRFAEEGRSSWVELDDGRRVVERGAEPDGQPAPARRAAAGAKSGQKRSGSSGDPGRKIVSKRTGKVPSSGGARTRSN